MNIDSVIYQNLEHLLDKNGITERQCVISCGLNLNYFVNYRKKRTKHFKIHDLMILADFFDVDINYLCDYKNSRDEFFVPKYKLKQRDEKMLLSAFRRLDPVGRILVADAINKEIENSKLRLKEKQQSSKKTI
ncbi:MAG: hypothetical protein IJR79_00735 [Clostridia bacterium]|nr:hypothetical protein [Clostridia bacterium]